MTIPAAATKSIHRKPLSHGDQIFFFFFYIFRKRLLFADQKLAPTDLLIYISVGNFFFKLYFLLDSLV